MPSPLSPLSLGDEELMSRLAAERDPENSDAIFSEIYARYHRRILAWCRRMSPDGDSAGDLAQEILLKAWRRRASFRGESRLSTWLFAIARNHCITALKRAAADPVQLELVIHDLPSGGSRFEPAAVSERNELCSHLLRVMTRTLDPIEVRIVALHYGHGIRLATITRDLALANPSGAKAYIVNARRKLRGAFERRGWDAVPAACPPPRASARIPRDCPHRIASGIKFPAVSPDKDTAGFD